MNKHLITTDASGRKSLSLFQSFEIDGSLPKHASSRAAQLDYTLSGNTLIASTNTITSVVPWTVSGQIVDTRLNPIGGFIKSFFDAARVMFGKAKAVAVEARSIPVESVFEAIAASPKKLKVLEGRLEAHKEAIKLARATGQTALAEYLEPRTGVVQFEAVLVADGRAEFIEEAQMVEFAERCERGLRLDWVRNFTRLIPHRARVAKARMDALQVFDNYAVLHYDPKGDASALTKREKAKKEDPILFGVLSGSRRLYHVASWKDEHCDLTFGALLDKFGRDALTLE